MSRFKQRVREAMKNPEFAAGYWEADAELQSSRSAPLSLAIEAPADLVMLNTSIACVRVQISNPEQPSRINWTSTPDVAWTLEPA
jgi:hypothetical protein